MKRKYKFLICLLTLNSLNQVVLSTNLPLEDKFDSKTSFASVNHGSDSYNLFELQKFIRNFVANLEDSDKNLSTRFSDIEILSDKQINTQDKLVVEVDLKSNNP